ncbi:hypothetical protein INS90_00980 [Trueperella pecoris]|uniref:Nucleotide modification associated domain-containing protein n=1 Tax=Trueperella pecoris TaxID=2733571 RepID=A0A7M1R1A9_9ACTO|nr:hypothetical protein [Trueperella pecoris]QOR45823.1 hypothetical protein INS88_00875 [Trueperella pecoris]QOR47918.1 hypothetical protein INS90_00980 [Trueperella pecoris]QTG75651.1 hypothetical protein J4179_00805 [Trueperella pecoris]
MESNETMVTMNDLHMNTNSFGALIQYGTYVLATNWVNMGKGKQGNTARLFIALEEPVSGFGPNSRGFNGCALGLVAEADDYFQDAGHAIAWAMNQINN